MNKIEWLVLESMEWRNKNFQPGEVIVDNENSYMIAMENQGKVKRK